MALHVELPIHKKAYDLLIATTELAKNMRRNYKPIIGSKLCDECIEIDLLIFRANQAENKKPFLDKLIERLQVAELLLRVSKDKRLISTKQYAQAIELTTSIGKQATGWRRKFSTPVSRESRLS